ncbi:alpha/beta hydrolase [Croceicoccus hydrothermalis]|uniref:alpha/beta hydrolase n=1 Tax=Croceicoccus hydrothermalis TaxID=2867964 RepID=UPI001EFB1ED6|nr:alpha/beta hydrolase [Croceicoccus hydrothermalis]
MACAAALTLAPVQTALAQDAPVADAGSYAATAMPAHSSIRYGNDALQTLDFFPGAGSGTGPRPLIVFVHGGAWVSGDKSDSTGTAKIRHYTHAGYNFATMNYRLLPDVDIRDQAQDVADAVAMLRNSAQTLYIDPRRIVLMGHSAGGHLAALVATDPQYLRARGMAPADIAGAVLIDAAALDVGRQIRAAGPLLGFAYELAFSGNAAMQNALSPTAHVESPNAGAMLMLHVDRDSAGQARIFADALENAGTPAQVSAFAGRGMRAHNEINNRLGRGDYPATQIVDEWLAQVTGG